MIALHVSTSTAAVQVALIRVLLWSNGILIVALAGSGGLVDVLLFPPYASCPGRVCPSKSSSYHALPRGHNVRSLLDHLDSRGPCAT